MSDIKRLTDLLKPRTPGSITYEINEISTEFNQYFSVYRPFETITKNKPGFTPVKKLSKSSGKTSNEDSAERSLRRSKKNIKGIVRCNDFDQFATFTIKADRQNIKKCKAKLTNWLKSQKKRNGNFKSLIVPEFHKDGKSLHFHALLSGCKSKLKPAISPKTGKQLRQKGRKVWQFVGYRSGFNNVVKIGKDADSQAKIANYVTKYISKDMPVLFGQNRYWPSKGLKRPIKVENPTWHIGIMSDRQFVNDYGWFRFYDKKNLKGQV